MRLSFEFLKYVSHSSNTKGQDKFLKSINKTSHWPNLSYLAKLIVSKIQGVKFIIPLNFLKIILCTLIVNLTCIKFGTWGFFKMKNSNLVIVLIYHAGGATSSPLYTFKIFKNFFVARRMKILVRYYYFLIDFVDRGMPCRYRYNQLFV